MIILQYARTFLVLASLALLLAASTTGCVGDKSSRMDNSDLVAEEDLSPDGATDSVRMTIGSEGGILEFDDGVFLTVPTGALTDDVTFAISRSTLIPATWQALTDVYSLEPTGTTFVAAATFRFPYHEQLIPDGWFAGDISGYLLNDLGDTWENVGGVINAGYITVTLLHLSLVAAGVPLGCPENDNDCDGFTAATDCDDEDPNVNPGQTETLYDDIDNDCDPTTLDDDLDGDGYGEEDDCDDENPAINPGRIEIPYNDIDDDCDEATPDDDLDGDGYPVSRDCADENAAVNPGATEIEGNLIDDDCNPATSDGVVDIDGDGYSSSEDCNDYDAAINPGATEIPYNRKDDDCNPDTPDNDLDGDGHPSPRDCDDENEEVNPGMMEIEENGIDDDCDPTTPD
jgi:Putative metal-binding motif